MNLPNKLTVLRILMIPVFLVFMLLETIPHRYLLAAIVFGLASFTDFLDGYLARKRGLVSNFGKLMDPLADKLLVFSALICFIPINAAHAVLVFIILARELLVTSVRLIAAEQGRVIAADWWGKVKTVVQIVWILMVLFTYWLWSNVMLLFEPVVENSAPPSGVLGLLVLCDVLQIAVVILTLFSGWNYIWKNRDLFSDIG
ncbi:MAG: CDP-diacylglycerol--glycerol-3-phosphate 3-phosphatidyltransferase [Anaerotruncus sp.]|nr:CDP-diacylglycerol--glycerol-3-phosphate 3-phosphatidyltransferase [Anaerotruncus sp.]